MTVKLLLGSVIHALHFDEARIMKVVHTPTKKEGEEKGQVKKELMKKKMKKRRRLWHTPSSALIGSPRSFNFWRSLVLQNKKDKKVSKEEEIGRLLEVKKREGNWKKSQLTKGPTVGNCKTFHPFGIFGVSLLLKNQT